MMGNFFFFLIANLLQGTCITYENSGRNKSYFLNELMMIVLCLRRTQNTAIRLYWANHHRVISQE